jgi:F0F1-type ATP synthase epsilon subunit
MVGVKPKKPPITMNKCFQVLFRQKVSMPTSEAMMGIKNQHAPLIPLEAGSLSEKLV